jgi:hypothetical protein
MEKIEELTADKERLKSDHKTRESEREAERMREKEKFEAKFREWERERADMLLQIGKAPKKAVGGLLPEEKSASGGRLDDRGLGSGSLASSRDLSDRPPNSPVLVANNNSTNNTNSNTATTNNNPNDDPSVPEAATLSVREDLSSSGAKEPVVRENRQGKMKKTFSYRPGERMKSMKLKGTHWERRKV